VNFEEGMRRTVAWFMERYEDELDHGIREDRRQSLVAVV
jgi:hypothetical protein